MICVSLFRVTCNCNSSQAALQPELLGGEYTHMDYNRRPHQRDLGKRILYRDAHMTGWAYKTVTRDDLKIPVVYGEGKRVRMVIVFNTGGRDIWTSKTAKCQGPLLLVCSLFSYVHSLMKGLTVQYANK